MSNGGGVATTEELAHLAQRQAIAERRAKGTTTITRGVMVLASIPFVMLVLFALALLGIPGAAAVTLVLLYTVVAAGIGIACLLVGASQRGVAARQLRELEAPRQLPEARLIER